MKSKLILFLTLFLVCEEAIAQYSAMTYNIRYATERDGINSWENRKEWVADLIDYYEPDVFGIQEGLNHQVAFLDSSLSEYSFEGNGRDDGKDDGEFAAIFYNNSKLEVVDSGTFWLSPTSGTPSYGWGANYRRICTWVVFKVRNSDQRFYVFNAHFDHESEEARIESAKLIHEKVEEFNEESLPLILMGDFNAVPESEPISFFNQNYDDSKIVSDKKPFGPIGTYNGFDTSHPLDVRIDYIFTSSKIRIEKYAVLSNTRTNRTPSDHLPVFINFSFK